MLKKYNTWALWWCHTKVKLKKRKTEKRGWLVPSHMRSSRITRRHHHGVFNDWRFKMAAAQTTSKERQTRSSLGEKITAARAGQHLEQSGELREREHVMSHFHRKWRPRSCDGKQSCADSLATLWRGKTPFFRYQCVRGDVLSPGNRWIAAFGAAVWHKTTWHGTATSQSRQTRGLRFHRWLGSCTVCRRNGGSDSRKAWERDRWYSITIGVEAREEDSDRQVRHEQALTSN